MSRELASAMANHPARGGQMPLALNRCPECRIGTIYRVDNALVCAACHHVWLDDPPPAPASAEEILAFAREHPFPKHQEVRLAFGYNLVRYYGRLSRVLDEDASLEIDRELVETLRARRDGLRERRSWKGTA